MALMKKFWIAIFFVSFVGVGSGWYFFSEPNNAEFVPYYVTQTITADSRYSRTITWQTALSETKQAIVYYAENSQDELVREVMPERLSTEAEPMAIYTVTLTGLTPGTKYFYKVGNDGAWSRWYSLRVAGDDKSDFKAIIFGDSQSENYDVWAKTVEKAWNVNRNADFFINMGDLVDIGSHYDQWKSWFNGVGDMVMDIPVAPISGNHENYLPGGTFTPAYLYKELFRLPHNGPPEMAGQVYSFDYGDTHFAVLDTQAEELLAFQPDILEKQAAWLSDDLAKTDKRWKIVLMHRPVFKNAYQTTLNPIGEVFVPIFTKAKVDIVFTAHIHTYARSVPLSQKLEEVAGGVVYISTGRSGDKTWDGAKRKSVEVVFEDSLSQPNYLVLASTGCSLKAEFFRQDGTLVDSYERIKP